jgi:glycine hydroxymethyltransferase
MHEIANFIDKAIQHHDNDEVLANVAASVNEMMGHRPLFKA